MTRTELKLKQVKLKQETVMRTAYVLDSGFHPESFRRVLHSYCWRVSDGFAMSPSTAPGSCLRSNTRSRL